MYLVPCFDKDEDLFTEIFKPIIFLIFNSCILPYFSDSIACYSFIIFTLIQCMLSLLNTYSLLLLTSHPIITEPISLCNPYVCQHFMLTLHHPTPSSSYQNFSSSSFYEFLAILIYITTVFSVYYSWYLIPLLSTWHPQPSKVMPYKSSWSCHNNSDNTRIDFCGHFHEGTF